ncbi:MAG TPA: FeoA family protein [Planctomycetaceae bacterium]|nr:FeoA family protein [Planctomycetaceae bacterium]
MIPLNLLKPGESGTIFDVAGSDSMVHRLSEMGLRVGSSVRMVKSGNPCILAIDNNRLSLRLDSSLQIMINLPS